jgi:hypothetical protein
MSCRTGRRPKPSATLFPASDLKPHAQPTKWWSRTGSNRRHPACKAGALPAELRPPRVSAKPKPVDASGGLRSKAPRALSFGVERDALAALDVGRFAASSAAATTSAFGLVLVGLGGLEPPTSRLSSARSNQLSYKPEQSTSGARPAGEPARTGVGAHAPLTARKPGWPARRSDKITREERETKAAAPALYARRSGDSLPSCFQACQKAEAPHSVRRRGKSVSIEAYP